MATQEDFFIKWKIVRQKGKQSYIKKKAMLLAMGLFLILLYIDRPVFFSSYEETIFVIAWYFLVSILISLVFLNCRWKLNEKKYIEKD